MNYIIFLTCGRSRDADRKSGHLAWCAPVALALAEQEGGVLSPAQENLFLIRWLATALEATAFPREINPDIEWLLNRGASWASARSWPASWNYLWRSCTGELSEQNDLFRLTYALETAKDMHWNYRLLSDRE